MKGVINVKILSLLSKIFPIRAMVREASKNLILYALERITELAKDENIDELETLIKKEISEKIKGNEILQEALDPALDVLFVMLRNVDDVARVSAEVLKKVG